MAQIKSGITTIGDSSDYATGINDSGTVIGNNYAGGSYTSTEGFIDHNGVVSDLSIPGSAWNAPSGINDAGTMIGSDAGGGFIDQDGTVSIITISARLSADPKVGAVNYTSDPTGINDKGEVVGSFYEPGDHELGFIYNHGTVTTFNATGDLLTEPKGVNDSGTIVGTASVHYGSAVSSAFVDKGGVFTSFNEPNATAVDEFTYTSANGIDAKGDIVGDFKNASGDHGFLLKGGKYTTFDVPGAANTIISSINENGTEVAGSYALADGGGGAFKAAIVGHTIG